ncbi:hypothetical protein BHE74_00059754 [Ensete ventricosum]|nr:hypothetical protein BHE74_00059754 [Ensete ventricosum]
MWTRRDIRKQRDVLHAADAMPPLLLACDVGVVLASPRNTVKGEPYYSKGSAFWYNEMMMAEEEVRLKHSIQL